MKRVWILFACVSCFFAGWSLRSTPPRVTTVRELGSWSEVARAGDFRLIVRGNLSDGARGQNEAWWGENAARGSRLVTLLEVHRGNRQIVVPLSACSGLSDVRRIFLTDVPNGCVIGVQGGDGGGSYSAAITIKDDVVTGRVIRSGEFPEEWWERTVYSTVPDDGR